MCLPQQGLGFRARLGLPVGLRQRAGQGALYTLDPVEASTPSACPATCWSCARTTWRTCTSHSQLQQLEQHLSSARVVTSLYALSAHPVVALSHSCIIALPKSMCMPMSQHLSEQL